MSLPIIQANNQSLMLIQTQWAQRINPIIGNPTNNMALIKNIDLSTGTNIINHKLGATPQGWFVCDITSSATIYRNAPFNSLTLSLYSSAPTTISLGVF